MKLNKNNTILDALNADEQTAGVFMSYGMHCIGCPSRSAETIEQAAQAHGVKVEEMLEKLNKILA